MHFIRKLIKNKQGQALVELALVLPILLMLVMGTVEFGRIFHSYLLITNATREGARAGIVGLDDTAIKTKVKEVSVSLGLTDSQISIEPGQSSRVRGVPLTVRVNYSIGLITPIVDAVVPNPFPLTASTTMRIE
ncbi:TadE-like protein [Pelotomaculum sp. FP]|uniref:TadE/TadG family type IV pilus assembly protein n=1 Tax=Pelotomaculum sp. FP TaxID=261474 RepID=UPI001064939F|nr:TadE family protein [Pelotomaculum sp. FP]TEB16845.1 TadE-like protein [Pelotomaculum sp. FP]